MKRPRNWQRKKSFFMCDWTRNSYSTVYLLSADLIDQQCRAGGCIENRPARKAERLQELEAPCNLHEWIFDINKAANNHEPPALKHPLVDSANEQQEFAAISIAAPEVYLIQGPPGTGKTTVIAELTNQLTHEGERCSIASQTNLAVDNALGRLKSKTNVRPVRHLGHFAAQDPDPESELFLENNVIESFFLPSVRDECAKAQERALNLFTESEAVKRFFGGRSIGWSGQSVQASTQRG